jgi:glucose/arabinose dehydrogenase
LIYLKTIITLLLFQTVLFGQIEIIQAFPNLDFDQPVDLQSPADNSNRLFVVEQEGEIYVFENFDSNTIKTQFLDIRDKVIYEGECGLLGLAFHPNYEYNGYFFINYTASNPLRTVIARYEVSTDDSNIADELSENIILEIDQLTNNHNGGQIAFGPDGYLYIGMGDGGGAGDPSNHGQNLETLLGAMLRIDINNTNEEYNYSIPINNPFINNNLGYRDEIYAYGLRNPWRFSFDNINGNCWIADVGQNDYEEIDILEYAGNYGWRIMEGFHCFDPATGCDTSGLILPIYEYDHNVGESITGGYVYRGSMLPSLNGLYIFADFVYGDVWSLEYDGGNPPKVSTLGDLGPYSVTSFGVDQQDELYICSFDGAIYKFVQTNSAGEHSNLIPNKFSLYQNYPNPFNPITTMSYDLPEDSFVNITIYDILGMKVKTVVNTTQNAGYKSVIWDATNNNGKPISAGVYLYQIQAGEFVQTKKMVLLK